MSEGRERIVAVIPARLASTRLPGKVLRPIAGVPMLGWVYRAALACPQLDQVLIATDSAGGSCVRRFAGLAQRHDLCRAGQRHGPRACRRRAWSMPISTSTSRETSRCFARNTSMPCCGPFARTDAEVTTLSTPCTPEEIDDPNAVKVVTANDGRALYFSRATIPYQRGTPLTPRKHIGIYAYRKAALRRFAELPPSPLESAERLEQLRLLEEGISIHVVHTPFDTIGVDTEEDLWLRNGYCGSSRE